MSPKSHMPIGDDSVLTTRLLDYLHRSHPIKTAENVSLKTGISAKTIQKWLQRESFPSGPAFLMLLDVYEAPLLAALYKPVPAWIVRASVARRLEEIRSEINILTEELDNLNAKLV